MSWNMEPDGHPSADWLRAFEDGTLPEEAVLEVEAHLEICSACCDALAGLPEDGFLSRLRRACENAPTRVAAEPASTPPAQKTVVLADSRTVAHPPGEAPMPPGYREVREVGRGGMGVVYAATHTLMERRVAVKVIHPEFSCHPLAADRFRREVRAAARLDHPNIVAVHDAGEHAGQPFLVMEYIAGESLSDVLQRGGPLSVAEACNCVRQAALGVQHAHDNGLIHRDLKPHNLVRAADGTVKVCDFGLVALVDDRARASGTTQANSLMGTPDYMAPEQAEDPRTADARSDVYALGCSLYHLLTGTVPFPEESVLLKLVAHRTCERPSVRRLRPEIPAALDGVLRRAMARLPQDRFQTPGDLAEALRPFTDPARPAPVRRRRGRALLALAALVVGVAGGMAALLRPAAVPSREPVRETSPLRSAEVPAEREKAAAKEKEAAKADEVRRFVGHDAYVTTVAFAPHGRHAVSASGLPVGNLRMTGAYDVRIWDVQTGEQLRKLVGGNMGYSQVVFSPDGWHVFAASFDTDIWMWDVMGRFIRKFRGHQRPVWQVALSPDGRQLFSAAIEEPDVRIWDVASGRETGRLPCKGSPGLQLVLSADNKRALASGDDDGIRVWDLETRTELAPLRGHDRRRFAVSALALSPDGRRAVSAGRDRTLRLWDTQTAKQLWSRPIPLSCYNALQFSRDGRGILAGGGAMTSFGEDEPNAIRLLDAATGTELRRYRGHTFLVSSLALAPDGRHFLSGSWDRSVRLWPMPDAPTPPTVTEAPARDSGRPQAPPLVAVHQHALEPMANTHLPPHTSAAAFSPDGKTYAVGGDDNLVRLWDRYSGQLLHTLRGHTGWIHRIRFTPDGKQLLSGSEDSTIRVWDLATGQQLHKLSGHTGAVGEVEASRDGKRLLSASADGTARIWDLEKAEQVHCLRVGESWCGAVFTRAGEQVVTWTGGDTLKAWNAATGAWLATKKGPPQSVQDCRVILGGKTLLVAGLPEMSWRDAATLREVRKPPPPWIVRSLNWDVSPDGRFLIAAHENEPGARLWDLEADKQVGQIALPSRPSGRLAFAPDSRHVAAGSCRGFVYLLRLEDSLVGAGKHIP